MIDVNDRPAGSAEPSNPDTSEAAQRLAAIVESSDDAIVSKDLNGIIQSWNKAAERIFGYTAEEAIGKPITIVIPTALHDQEPLILSKIARGERVDRFETIRQRKDGSQFHVSLTVSPIRNREGKIIGASKIGRDISDLRQSQERQDLLLREMNHRVKNLFAVASGVVALSARSSNTAADLAHIVQSRLSALSRAHELILPPMERASHVTVGLADLVHTVLSPYDDHGKQIPIEGPVVACGPATSTSFALLLHEFATNSVKYGALSTVDGHVAVSWAVKGETLELIWSERGFPAREDPDRAAGFGTFLVEATVRGLSAQIDRRWSDAGLAICVRVPVGRLAT